MILAFDTATRATTVALCGSPAGELELRDDPPPGVRPAHAGRLLPLAVELLARAGSGWQEVERIAVGIGPGTFTGLRIGIATAKALARARGLPLVGVSTLRSLALNASRDQADAVAAVLDARRGEVFAAIWLAGQIAADPAESNALVEAHASSPQALAQTIAGLDRATLAVGEGAIEFREVLELAGAVIPQDDSELHRVSAINHCRLAVGLRDGAPDDLQPQYLRLPDAEIARRAAGKS